MDIQGYVDEIHALYASGQSTEHSFRPALAKLFGSIDPALIVINEPKHLTDVDAPDFACGSACKKDPVSGVIGVQKGPPIPVV